MSLLTMKEFRFGQTTDWGVTHDNPFFHLVAGDILLSRGAAVSMALAEISRVINRVGLQCACRFMVRFPTGQQVYYKDPQAFFTIQKIGFGVFLCASSSIEKDFSVTGSAFKFGADSFTVYAGAIQAASQMPAQSMLPQ